MGQPDLAQKRHQVAARAGHTEAPLGLWTTQAGQFGRAAFLAAGRRDDEPPLPSTQSESARTTAS